ncbi:hypothetical protein [Longimicrobium sp.]|uniref:hypothetical protein n=1 Tax=Longimicrobium sp. TaxID=2029185 RepID=UPI002CE60378|nr:hypothetical protein [Longimicrobium sp.]HSU16935.1 hypothetical protein [Longimicrobium sp.]
MAKRVIEIPQQLDDALASYAAALGESEADIIARAIESYLEDGIEPAEITDPDEVAEIVASTAGMWTGRTDPDRLTLLRAGRGMWKDREDLPDSAARRNDVDHRTAVIPTQLEEAVRDAAVTRGVPEHEIVTCALRGYLAAPAVVPATITDPEEVAAARKAAVGMWKDRSDVPDVRELRRGWRRRLRRVMPDE